MKKLYSIMASLLLTASLSAETLQWRVNDLTGLKNNDLLHGVTLTIDKNFSLLFDNGTATENNYCKYRKTTDDQSAYINFYSKNTMTLKGTDATITSVKFIVDENADSPQTTATAAGWKIKQGSTTYSITLPTWTGSETEVTFESSSRAPLLGLDIEYTVTGEGGGDEETDPQPDPEEPQSDGLLFSAAQQFPSNEEGIEHTVTLTDEGIKIVFSCSAKGVLDDGAGYYGTPEEYITIPYRLRPGGSSGKGIDSPYKGIITLEKAGKLTIYAFNNQSTDRKLQIVQNDKDAFIHTFQSSEVKTSTDGKNRNVYPIYEAELEAGTAYILWPDNQLMMHGFKFEAADDEGGNGGGEETDPDPDPEIPVDPTPGPDEPENMVLLSFNEDFVGSGAEAQDLTLTDGSFSAHFISNSGSVGVNTNTTHFGTADSYRTFTYRYQPGSKSSNGTNSTTMATLTIPTDGTLYIYARNGSTSEVRTLEAHQDGDKKLEVTYALDRFETTTDANTVYPIDTVKLQAGTAHLIWPNNQVFFYGLGFAADGTTAIEEITFDKVEELPAYNIMGLPVGPEYKGIVIQGGKKYLRR